MDQQSMLMGGGLGLAAGLLAAALAWLVRGRALDRLQAGLEQTEDERDLALGDLALARQRLEDREARLDEQKAGLQMQEERIAALGEALTRTTGELRARETQAERVPGLEDELNRTRHALSEQREQVARTDAAMRKQQEAMAEQRALLTEAQTRLSEAFKALASDALKHNSSSFLELARENLTIQQNAAKGELDKRRQAVDELVKPLREQLTRYETQIHEMERRREGSYKELLKQVELLDLNQRRVGDETRRLTLALSQPKTRGRWGEQALKNVVELAGMTEFCDFNMEVSTETEEGRLRPDMVVRLPGGGQIVVDAKTSIQAYLDALATDDPDQQRAALQRHAGHVRSHMEKLAMKNYWAQFETAPDFVVMFVQGENFLTAAAEQDPKLIEDGFRNRVIPTAPSMLVAILRTAAMAWQQERLAASAREIQKIGTEIYDRLGLVAGHLGQLGKTLTASVQSYNKTVSSLESRLLPSARRFKQMGLTPSKELPSPNTIDEHAKEPSAPELFDTPADDASGSDEARDE